MDTVRLGPHGYRIVRPGRALGGASVYETTSHTFDMAVDQDAAVTLAMAWGLAARSPHSLIYLPLRHPHAGRQQPERLLDLVLLHHSLAFPISRWKQVRQRLTAGTPLRVTLPSGTFNDRPLREHRAWTHDDFRDYLRWDTASETLFLIGSRHAFDLQADQIRGLAEDGAARAAESRYHYCAEITLGEPRMSDKRNRCSELHIQYGPRDAVV